MKIKKNLKPIEYDIHLKYLCPNVSCCCPHWLSFKESSTKNFKVVCDCGQVFSINRTKSVNIEYHDLIDRPKSGSFETKNHTNDQDTLISKSMKALAIDLMKTYGFTELEALPMIDKAIMENPSITDHVTLVKHSLFWINND